MNRVLLAKVVLSQYFWPTSWTLLKTIIPLALMASKLIAHSSFGLMGYWVRAHSGARNKKNYVFFFIIFLLSQLPITWFQTLSVKGQWTRKTFSSGPKRHFFIAILSNKNVNIPVVENGHQSAVSLRLFCWRVWVITINRRLQALNLHIILRGFRRVYKQRDLYPWGLIKEIEKALYNKL